MSFFSLQSGAQIFVLNKESVPMLSVGSVVTVSPPRPSPSNWQQTLVTVTADFNGASRVFENLPSDKEMADSMTGVQVFCNRELALSEVQRMRKVSAQIVSDIDKHKAIVKACDDILCELSPEIAEKAMREKELKEMKAQLDEMKELFRQAVAAKTEKQ